MISPSQLRSYFKNIAIHHPQILHQDAEGKIAFAIDRQSDLLDGVFRTGLKAEGFSLRYGTPQFRTLTNDTSGLMATVDMAFAILKKANPTAIGEIEAATDESFDIVKGIIARLVYDSRKRNPILGGSLNQLSEGDFVIEETLFQGDGTWAGHLCLFHLKSEFIDDIDTLVQSIGYTDLI